MLVKENIFPGGNKELYINSFSGSIVSTNGKLVEATAGNSWLKAYISLMSKSDQWLTDGEVYSIGVDFENLSDNYTTVYFKGMSVDSKYTKEPKFKGRIVDTSKKRDLDHVQIQISSTKIENDLAFRYDNISINKGEPSELWIPAKADLPNSQQSYYPPDGDYNEIKAI